MTIYELPPTPSGMDEEAWRAAVSAIRHACGWHIAPSVTETLTVEGDGSGLLLLPTLHLTGVSAVSNDGEALADLTDKDAFQWSRRGVLRWNRRWSAKYDGVSVTITHGYDDFPPELLAVARAMAGLGFGTQATMLVSGPHTMMLSKEAQAGGAGNASAYKHVLDRYTIPRSV